jgi:ketosteroid isomerase-like protein
LKEHTIEKTIFTLIALALLPAAGFAATPAELAKPVRQFINGFNSGDTKSAFAAFAPGVVTIVDEFAPHRWSGPHAAQDWAADYDKHATATGVTEGKVTAGDPIRIEVEGPLAYVIMPTVYYYKEHGKPLQEEGQITVVLHHEPTGWKMQGWTWSGVKPHPAK